MDYLALVQRVKLESGLAGGGPTTLASAIGDTRRMVGWVADAYRAIQLMPRNWRWMRASVTGTITPAARAYSLDDLAGSAGNRFSHWLAPQGDYRPAVWPASGPVSVEFLTQMTYERFVREFEVGEHMPGAPRYWCEAPDGRLLVGPTPDQDYKLRVEYFKSPQELTNDTDVPDMPVAFHMGIVWYALITYGAHDAAPDVIARANGHWEDIEVGLLVTQAEEIRWV